MLLLANLFNTKWCKSPKKNDWNPGTWVLNWEYLTRAIQWVPIWQSLDGFQKSLHPCASDKRSLRIWRVNTFTWALKCHLYEVLCQGVNFVFNMRNPKILGYFLWWAYSPDFIQDMIFFQWTQLHLQKLIKVVYRIRYIFGLPAEI